jgi:hypothetical protein
MPALFAELTCYYRELSGGGAGLNTAPELSGAPVKSGTFTNEARTIAAARPPRIIQRKSNV